METKWAAEHLQVIRTLMERSALYRRALAPVMLVSGAVGLAGATLGAQWEDTATVRGFSLCWLGTGTAALAASLLLVRRQALREAEAFWSLPTRRVAGGLLPCFLTGLALGVTSVLRPELFAPWLLASLWTLLYGSALHAAGFFMQRGIKLFGTAYLAVGLLLLAGGPLCPWMAGTPAAHTLMGAVFGLPHLAYGAYLYFTERRTKS